MCMPYLWRKIANRNKSNTNGVRNTAFTRAPAATNHRSYTHLLLQAFKHTSTCCFQPSLAHAPAASSPRLYTHLLLAPLAYTRTCCSQPSLSPAIL